MVTPVATSVENAVDDEPAVSCSKEVANQTSSIIHDEGDERPHDEAIIITNELLTDTEDLPGRIGAASNRNVRHPVSQHIKGNWLASRMLYLLRTVPRDTLDDRVE